MSVKQSIKVTNAGLSPILSVAQGTGAIEYEFTVSDFDIPSGSAAVAYNIQPTGNIVSQTCSISGNAITVKPPAYYFLRGKNYMQFQVSRSNEDLFSFLIEVWCAPNISQPEVIVAQNPSLISQLLSAVGDVEGKEEQNAEAIEQNASQINALNSRVGKNEQDITVLDSRVDALQNIPEGSTTSDAALNDVKIGWDGTTYDSPGDAVRGQAEQIIGGLIATVYLSQNNTIIYNIDDKTISFPAISLNILGKNYSAPATEINLSEVTVSVPCYRLCYDYSAGEIKAVEWNVLRSYPTIGYVWNRVVCIYGVEDFQIEIIYNNETYKSNLTGNVAAVMVDEDDFIIYDVEQRKIEFPTSSVLSSGTRYPHTAEEIDLTQVTTTASAWSLYFNYNTNKIEARSFTTPSNYLFVGYVYDEQIIINGVPQSNIKRVRGATEIRNNEIGFEGIRDQYFVVYDYTSKVIQFPAGFCYAYGDTASISTQQINVSNVLNAECCLLYIDDNGTISASSWGTVEKNKCLLGYIFGKNVFIFGVPQKSIIVRGENILFFGDSIVAGVGCNTPFHVYFYEWSKEYVCKNYGIGGTGYVRTVTDDSTLTGNGVEGKGSYEAQNGNNAVLSVMQSAGDMAGCVIAAGTNDYGTNVPLDDFQSAVESTLDYAQTKTSKILVLTPLKREGYEEQNGAGHTLTEYANVIINECEARGIAYCDGFSVAMNPDNEASKNSYMTDGLHPNDAGQRRMAQAYFNTFLESME